MSRWFELVSGAIMASWRAGLGWSVAFVLFIVSTVAFWPAFKDSAGFEDIFEALPPAMVEAFGLRDFTSPAGYLRGGLYEVLVPFMFAAAGVMFANSATAGEEDAGRLELYLAQPVRRQALFTARSLAVMVWLVALMAVVLVSQLASDVAFELEIADDRVIATIVLCALLGAFHAGLAAAVAGVTARPAVVLSIGLGFALLGYLVAVLFPLSDVLEPWSRLSPWDWALGGDPLVNPTEPWRYLALAAPAVALVVLGAIAFGRRDVRSA